MAAVSLMRNAPMPWMTNTVMLGVSPHTRTMISPWNVGDAVNLAAGRWTSRPASSCSRRVRLYPIEDGKVTAPNKATLIGNGPDALTKVMMVGDDMALDPGVGTRGVRPVRWGSPR